MLVFQIFSKYSTKPFLLKHLRGNIHFLSILVLSCTLCPIQGDLSGQFVQTACLGCPIPVVLSLTSCHNCPVIAVLPRLSRPFRPSQMSCSCCFFLPPCPLFLGLALLPRLSSLVILSWLSWLSCPGRPVPDVLSPCPFPALLFRLFCPGCPVPAVL
jgi:hypothetical protein